MEKGVKRVMIVDDDESVISVLKKVLEANGMEVTAVTNGKDCLKELEAGFKGVLLMDVVMPEMDGWETIREIVKKGLIDRVIISMLTGKDEPDTKMADLKEYVLDYIKKPFKSTDLVEVVNEYLSYLK
ncbi:response regulator [candidate division KSB1 bacterium]|nr:MAG: response regulator [candidate division KSB1 bacterium]